MTLIKVKGRGAENPGRRNLILNGAMKVAQRGSQNNGTGISGTACDRFRLAMSGGAAVTTTQDADVPNLSNGFRNSLKVDCTTADTSVAAGDYVILYQRLEGQDLQHLLYGTTAHKKITVQFWVKSPKTGTHYVEIYHLDASYFSSQQYTISAADTWEKKTVTFVGYPTSSFDDDSEGSLQLDWWLLGGSTYSGGTHNSNTWHNTQANRCPGQVNVLDDTANNFYLTGVQLEVSDLATDFEHRSYGEELSLCQRYYNRLGLFYARVRQENVSSQNPDFATTITFPPMRDAPTINTYTDANYSSSGTTATGGSSLGFVNISTSSANASMNSGSSGAQNISNSAYLELDKEI